MNIQWFPGHMTKAVRMMEENLRLVDALIYVLDSRAVASCCNPIFDRLTEGKPTLFVFNKCDLVESRDLEMWSARFQAEGRAFVSSVGISGDCSQIVRGLKNLARDKLRKFAARGAEVSVRAMVVGVPNSGKSTIINSMCRKAKAVTGDRPGVTRGKQWLSVDGIDFLDTPGTLWGKFEDQSVAHNLAYIGSIRDEVLDESELAFDFLTKIAAEYPDKLCERYGLEFIPDDISVLFGKIALRRGALMRGGEPDYERAARLILDDFRKGRMGKIMLEKPNDGKRSEIITDLVAVGPFIEGEKQGD